MLGKGLQRLEQGSERFNMSEVFGQGYIAKHQRNWAELALIPLSPTIHPTSNIHPSIQHPPNKVFFAANMYLS